MFNFYSYLFADLISCRSPSASLTPEVLSFPRSRRPVFPDDLEQLSAPLARAIETPLMCWGQTLGDELFDSPIELRVEAIRARHAANTVFIESVASEISGMVTRLAESAKNFKAQSQLLQAANDKVADVVKAHDELSSAFERAEEKAKADLQAAAERLAAREAELTSELERVQAEAAAQREVDADIIAVTTLADGIRACLKMEPPGDYSLWLGQLKKTWEESPIDPAYNIPLADLADQGVDLSFLLDPLQLSYPDVAETEEVEPEPEQEGGDRAGEEAPRIEE